jgi:glucoamylase
MKFAKSLCSVSALICSINSVWAAGNSGLDTWVSAQKPRSLSLMLADISRPGTAKGSVVAAPLEGVAPNYYYHWVRDSGLTMQVVVNLYAQAQGADQQKYFQILSDFVDFSSNIQQKPNRSGNPWDMGPGEPKFMVDGSVDMEDWGRPQTDGPALRASAMIHFANILIDQGQMALVNQKLYQSTIPATTLIKADLEFVSHHWQDESFDLWEETKGIHFYTRMVQRRALIEGAEFANRMGDSGAAAFYSSQAQQIEDALASHWSASKNYLIETLGQDNGQYKKVSDLDVAVILGALHGAVSLYHPQSMSVQEKTDNELFGITDDRVILTALHLKQAFQNIYAVNQETNLAAGIAPGFAPGIGRYPEDTYTGYATDGQGDPWFLATFAFAETYYKLASSYEASSGVPVTQAFQSWFQDLAPSSSIQLTVGETVASTDSRFPLILSAIHQAGDGFMARCQIHADPTGPISEQFNRSTGFMQGAQNLTWSHASFITAAWAREAN